MLQNPVHSKVLLVKTAGFHKFTNNHKANASGLVPAVATLGVVKGIFLRREWFQACGYFSDMVSALQQLKLPELWFCDPQGPVYTRE